MTKVYRENWKFYFRTGKDPRGIAIHLCNIVRKHYIKLFTNTAGFRTSVKINVEKESSMQTIVSRLKEHK